MYCMCTHIHTQLVKTHSCKLWSTQKHITHVSSVGVYRQTAGQPSRNGTGPWQCSHLCVVLPYCEVKLLKRRGWGEGDRASERGTNEGRAAQREKVKRIDLLSWIRDLTADGPQSLEAVPDGVDVGHSHEHHLAVGVVL